MKNKNGFTLIELLAVIVILAIIALISTPAVLTFISDSKTKANKESARAFLRASELYCTQQMLANQTLPTSVTSTAGVVAPAALVNATTGTYKGTAPYTASVTINSSCQITAASVTVTNGGSALSLAQLQS